MMTLDEVTEGWLSEALRSPDNSLDTRSSTLIHLYLKNAAESRLEAMEDMLSRVRYHASVRNQIHRQLAKVTQVQQAVAFILLRAVPQAEPEEVTQFPMMFAMAPGGEVS